MFDFSVVYIYKVDSEEDTDLTHSKLLRVNFYNQHIDKEMLERDSEEILTPIIEEQELNTCLVFEVNNFLIEDAIFGNVEDEEGRLDYVFENFSELLDNGVADLASSINISLRVLE